MKKSAIHFISTIYLFSLPLQDLLMFLPGLTSHKLMGNTLLMRGMQFLGGQHCVPWQRSDSSVLVTLVFVGIMYLPIHEACACKFEISSEL